MFQRLLPNNSTAKDISFCLESTGTASDTHGLSFGLTPLLCAGITFYAPMLRHSMNQPGKYIEVIGLGGLGHMAVKFGKAFGLHVTVFSTCIAKKEEALNLLGADKIVVSSDQKQMMGLEKSLDFRVGTASGDHPFDPFMSLLKIAGIYVLYAFPSEVKFSPASLYAGMQLVYSN